MVSKSPSSAPTQGDLDPDALDALFGNIWHQGTVYPATAPAVPFLLEVLASKKANLPGLLTLLTSIAGGASYLDVHQSIMPPSRRPKSEEVEASSSGFERPARRSCGERLISSRCSRTLTKR